MYPHLPIQGLFEGPHHQGLSPGWYDHLEGGLAVISQSFTSSSCVSSNSNNLQSTNAPLPMQWTMESQSMVHDSWTMETIPWTQCYGPDRSK